MDRDDVPITSLHASFGEYMRDIARSGTDVFHRLEKHHIYLAGCCFQAMDLHLKFNICELPSSYLDDEDIPDLARRKDEKLPMHLRYACVSWAHHLRGTTRSLLASLEYFTLTHLLFWLEVMGLIGQGREAAPMLLHARNWCKVRKFVRTIGESHT
jgi:hypothetical protein